jgi:cysteine sulfinate desulfinase/cysteine desulfurase-like protein/glyoxylase-like metal-dependent hydrolase (beta-lactamase superfamily II)/rhodanese-related sulfurtransferase
MLNVNASNNAYLDCNATTPTLPVAAAAALKAMQTLYGNPSSSHLVGLQAKAILESTRRLAADAVGAAQDRIIFTSGATEAIQTAVFSALQAARERGLGAETTVLYGATEHKAVPQALEHWVGALGLPYQVVELPVDERGLIRLDVLKRELPKAALLCTMAVNNETGVIQDLQAIEKCLLGQTAAFETLWLVDCVQALGKVPLELAPSRIDYAPFSGHKLYAPKGIGFLYASARAPLTPLIVGGGQEGGMRSGTENLPGVAAFGAVLELLNEPRSKTSALRTHAELEQFRDRIIDALKHAFPKVEFNTPFECSVPTTVNFSVPGFSSRELMDLFDSAGLRLSAGSACNSASVKPSHVLDAMKMPEWRSTSALRLSFGPASHPDEIERACQLIRESAMALQTSCLLEAPSGFDAPEHLRDGLLHLRAGASNSWIVANREARTCVIIDPCDTLAERIEHYIRCQNLTLLAVLDTHSHGDHESVRPLLQKLLADQMPTASDGAHRFDLLGWPESQEQVTLQNGAKAPALVLGPADSHASLVLARVSTPGHTDDSHAFLLGTARQGRLVMADVQFAFCGDTILGGGLGRTNFSMSDPSALFRSLHELQTVLAPTTLLCPAHDYTNTFATTLETETRENPLLRLALQSEGTLDLFVAKKREIDRELARLEQEFQGVVCGVSSPQTCASEAGVGLTLTELKQLQKSGRAPIAIDVREPQEFSIFKGWEALGLSESPRNVPLSRFANYMGELASASAPGTDAPELLLVCRSGTRSLQAAKSLRRLGLAKAWNLTGGMAFTS